MAVVSASKSWPTSEIFATVRRYWGFSELRPLQEEAIRAGLDRRDSLVVMLTGGGKSLCYQVPPELEQRTDIVVSPLIAFRCAVRISIWLRLRRVMLFVSLFCASCVPFPFCWAKPSIAISGSDNLNADAFRILDVEPRVEVLAGICAALFQFPRNGVPVEFFNPDREMIHEPGRALMV